MLLNTGKKQVITLYLFLNIVIITALARVDNNWSRRPNVTVSQQHGVATGYRPAVGVGYQQPAQWNRQNFTNPNYKAGVPYPAQTNRSQPAYPQYPSRNQTRSSAPNFPQNPAFRPQPPAGGFNQTHPQPVRPNYPQHPPVAQYPAYIPTSLNNTRPQPSAPLLPSKPNTNPSVPTSNLYPQNPAFRPQPPSGGFNQTHPQAVRPNYPQHPPAAQYPAFVPTSLNNTRPQPSAPLLPSNPNTNPLVPTSNLYPKLPPPPPQPVPQSNGNNGIPLAPLQPAPQNPQTPQGPHNWHSGGQAILSYGPGYYPSPAGQPNKNQPNHQGSSNPYANMFI